MILISAPAKFPVGWRIWVQCWLWNSYAYREPERAESSRNGSALLDQFQTNSCEVAQNWSLLATVNLFQDSLKFTTAGFNLYAKDHIQWACCQLKLFIENMMFNFKPHSFKEERAGREWMQIRGSQQRWRVATFGCRQTSRSDVAAWGQDVSALPCLGCHLPACESHPVPFSPNELN